MSKIKQIEYPGWDKKVKPAFTKLKNLIDLKELHDNLEKLGNEIILKHAEKKALQDQGIVNANVHYKDEKYMFLMHPQEDGKRHKEYIGSNKTHQNATLKAVERYGLWLVVCQELDDIRARCERLERQYMTFRDNLDPKNELKMWYGF